jgi:hypothetical protein
MLNPVLHRITQVSMTPARALWQPDLRAALGDSSALFRYLIATVAISRAQERVESSGNICALSSQVECPSAESGTVSQFGCGGRFRL